MTRLGTTELSKHRRTEIHLQIYANDFCLSNAARESIKFQKFTRVPAARIYLHKREKEKNFEETKRESASSLDSCTYVCWILWPFISRFSWFSSIFLSPWSFSPSLSLSFRFFSFLSSWGQNRDHASPSFPFFGVVHSLASPPHISRLRRSPAKFHDGFDLLRYNATVLTMLTIAISEE